MTVAEANRFLGLVTRHYGHEFRPEKKPWQSIRAFFHANVAAADSVRYLRELKRRKREGEPLIRW